MREFSVHITTKFSEAEVAKVKAAAKAAGVPFRTFIRRSAVSQAELSAEGALVVAEVARVGELLRRLWSAQSEHHVDASVVRDIAREVSAIPQAVMVAMVREKNSVARANLDGTDETK